MVNPTTKKVKKPTKKNAAPKTMSVKLIVNIRYRFEVGGVVYRLGDQFDIPAELGKIEVLVERVKEVASAQNEVE